MGLTLRNVSKSFDSNKVLDNINLNIDDGNFVCIVGFSGCGKTTLLRVVGGFESYTGTVLHDDKPIIAPSPTRFMVFQELNQLLPWKTTIENIAFGPKLSGNKSSRKPLEMLELVGLTDARHKYPHELSGGMKQRTAIARALVMNPSILLMDEPFGSLDAQTRRRLQSELVQIWQTIKITILFVTHNIRESIFLADRVVVLSKKGRIQSIFDIELPRPRNVASADFGKYWTAVLKEMEVKQ